MRVLMISTDRSILEEGSAARARMAEYGLLVEELHIVVFAKREGRVLKVEGGKTKIASNVWVYPTDSFNRWFYIHDAIKIGKKILSVSPTLHPPLSTFFLLSCQDPFETGRVGLSLKRRFTIPLQIQIHTDFLSPYFAKQSFLNKLRVFMAKKALAQADCIRVVSERIKNSLLKTTNYKLKTLPLILPLFIDQERFRSSADPLPDALDLHKKYPQFAFIILMAARLVQEKNIPCALRALKEVVGKYGRTGLVIAGEGPLHGELIKEMDRLGLQNNVIFEGQVSAEEMPSYYRSANAFLLTSDYEGYCTALVEAALSGCPIITTDVGVAATFFTDKRDLFICPVGDAACLANRVTWLIEDVSLRESFASRAREAAPRHLYTKEEYLKLYREMWEGCVKM